MKRHTNRQEGIVSFMVTLIMMLVISLIVIGFSQTARRTAREALDAQLSSQAFYAAESGVNMVASEIRGGTLDSKETCAPNDDYPVTSLSTDDGVKVTCTLVNPTPDDIVVSASQTASTVVPIYSSSGASLTKLSFAWIPPTGLSGVFSGCSALGSFSPQAPNNCNFALLRVDLMKDVLPAGSTNDQKFTSLTNNMVTFYMQPQTSSTGTVSMSDFSNPKGRIVGARCDSDKCSVSITLSGSAQAARYHARISTMYRDTSRVTITGNDGAITFSDAQVVIDSTGKAQDVLRRVQARYPLGVTTGDAPYSLQSGSTVCKKFTVANGQVNSYSSSCP